MRQNCIPATMHNTPDYIKLLMQIDLDELRKHSHDGDWSGSEGQRIEKDSSEGEIKKTLKTLTI